MVAPPTPPYLGPAAHDSGGGNKPINRVVIHCTVSPCEKGGARNIAAYFRNPNSGGSAHYVVDPGEVVQVVYDGTIAWHAPPNTHSIGVELCDPMSGSGDRWDDADHRAMLDRAAVLVAQLCLAYDVPLRRIGVRELLDGKRGITGHNEVSDAWRQSSHWDPGPAFPWKRFMRQVQDAADDISKGGTARFTEEDDMPLSDDDIARIWAHRENVPGKSDDTIRMGTALAQTWNRAGDTRKRLGVTNTRLARGNEYARQLRTKVAAVRKAIDSKASPADVRALLEDLDATIKLVINDTEETA